VQASQVLGNETRNITHAIAHGDFRLLGHGNPFHEAPDGTVLVLKLLPEVVWNSVVSVATKDRLFLRTMHFSTLQSHSVNLCGLPLHG
jgi:hypothetical protein